MTASTAPAGQSKNLVLAAMIFAVSMTFIDQTIVSIAVPQIQRELGLTSTGVQWVVNAYLLSLAALFAFGGRLADTVGHRKMVVIGVIVFAARRRCAGSPRRGARPRRGSSRSESSRVPAGPSCSRRRWRSWCRRSRCGRRGKALAAVLRHRRRSHRGRSDPGRLSDGVDLAGHLLGEHPGGDHRLGPDRDLEAGHGLPPGPHGLPGSRADRVRRRAERVRVPAVRDLGLGQPGHLAVHRRRCRAAGRCSGSWSCGLRFLSCR